jgi:flagellar hook assembly protein FlgD
MLKPLGRGGVALLLVLAAALPGRCALLSDLAAIPNPFSPNEDGTYDSTLLSYTLADSVWTVVAVEDSLGGTVRELWSGFQTAGSYGFVWDGRETGGTLASDGAYTFSATADAERKTLEVVLDTAAPVIEGLSVTPSRFTPDGDGVSDSLLVRFVATGVAAGDLVSCAVTDDGGAIVATLLAATGVDTVSLSWDGTGEGGAAPDTTYRLVVEALDSAGNATIERSVIDLDVDPPGLGSSDPDSSGVVAVDTTVVTITGWSHDRAGVDSVEYSTDGTTWTTTELDAHGAVAGAFLWSFELICPACTLDVMDQTVGVTVRAYDGTLTADGKGHANGESTDPPWLSFDVVFDVAEPVHSTSFVTDGDTVYEPGEEVRIETVWDQAGYDIEAFFYQLDSGFDPEDVEVSDLGDGSYDISYTISSSSTLVPAGPARVRVVASDFFHSVSDSTVVVSVVEPASPQTGLSVDRNSFDPGDDETVTINPGGSTGTAEIEIYNMAGALVASLEADAGTDVEWDGTNEDGEIVASGVYFLLIRVNGDETVRKVAVVK